MAPDHVPGAVEDGRPAARISTTTEDSVDYDDDCGNATTDNACGGCAACREVIADGIERDVESGALTWAEARAAHVLNGTWDARED